MKTSEKGNQIHAIEFTIHLGTIAIFIGVIKATLKFPERKGQPLEFETTNEEVVEFLDLFRYDWPKDKDIESPIKTLTKIEKNRMSTVWQFLFSHVFTKASAMVCS